MIFQFETIDVALCGKNKSLYVELNYQDDAYLTLPMLSELEEFFEWCQSHIEVQNIIISSKLEDFCRGLELNYFKENPHQLPIALKRLRKIILQMTQLPQTIITRAHGQCESFGLEFLMGADILIGSLYSKCHFNFIAQGLLPCCGGQYLLEASSSKAKISSWLINQTELISDDLLRENIFHFIYKTEEEYKDFIHRTTQASALARTQLKSNLRSKFIIENYAMIEQEHQIGLSLLQTGDWQRALLNQPFLAPKDWALLLKNMAEESNSAAS